MPLTIVGIDEAGYGPLLGPLCVAAAALRLEDGADAGASPDLWKVLRAGVTREPGCPRGRIAVDDSKKLKLPGGGKTGSPTGNKTGPGARHPLTHLERAVLAFARGAGIDASTDRALLGALTGTPDPLEPLHACYHAAPDAPLPLSTTPAMIAIASNVLRGALEDARVRVAGLRLDLVGEAEFNRRVREARSKAAAVGESVAAHLRWAWNDLTRRAGSASGGGNASASGGASSERVWVVCDRLGGRAAYADFLARSLGAGDDGAVTVEVVEESERRSRYVVREGSGAARVMGVTFLVEGDGAHLPVALASMLAKTARELCMARFNRHWAALLPEVKPTAGYAQDGRRWLDEATHALSDDDREALVRIA
jgi:hypothetical protein